MFYAIRLHNDPDTIVVNHCKQTVFRLFLDAALKTVAYRIRFQQASRGQPPCADGAPAFPGQATLADSSLRIGLRI